MTIKILNIRGSVVQKYFVIYDVPKYSATAAVTNIVNLSD